MPERSPSIRYHHLDLWCDFITSYSAEFGGKKPWEMDDFEFEKVISFTGTYLRKGINSEIWTVQSFGSPREDFDMRKHYEVLKDIVGLDQDSHEKVLVGRILFFVRVIDIARFDEKSRIDLIKGRDDYCKSCAVGNHCRKSFFQNFRFDRDAMYKKILGQNYVTMDQLFDPEFHSALQKKAMARYPSWFKD